MNEVNTEKAIKQLILGAAPERETELEILWNELSPQIEFTMDKDGFSLAAGSFGVILFNHKSMAQIWLLGFAAQYAFNAYLPYLRLSQLLKRPIASDDFSKNRETMQLVTESLNLIKLTIGLNTAHKIDEFEWPVGIPEPSSGKPSDVNGSMVFDLLCMGGAYCFLHEIKHLYIRNSGENIDAHDEEMQCDAFARCFLLDQIAEYSKNSGYPLEAVKAKRAMGIGLTSLLLFTLTPKTQWFGSDSHPSILERISALTDYLELSAGSYFWAYLSCIIIIVMQYKKIEFSFQAITSQKDFCLFLLRQLNNEFNKHIH